MPLQIDVFLFNPPFGSPAARGVHFPQPSLLIDTGGKVRGAALAISHMLAAAIYVTMPRDCRWRVHVDERFSELAVIQPEAAVTRRRIWVELTKGESVQQALDTLKIVARREGLRLDS